MKPVIWLDRDGTLITEQDYLKDPAKVRFLSGAIIGLQKLSKAGFPLVVVTNQSGVARGLMTASDVEAVNRRFKALLRTQRVRLAGLYWCPHLPTAGCSCRKPRLGLLRKAARRLRRSWRGGISVGDKWSDVALGQRSGGRGILVKTGYGRKTLKDKKGHRAPDFVASNFKAAAGWILKNMKENQHG